MRATVITDASLCRHTKAAGWAAWIRLDGRAEAIKRFGAFAVLPQTVNQAEIMAAANGVYLAVRAGASHVLVQSDSMTVVNGILGKGPYAPVMWRNAIAEALVKRDLRIPEIIARHVKGHTTTGDARSYVNRWCDVQAKRARRKGAPA